MSISIKLEPQKVQPVYNEIILVLDSTNKNKDEFQWVIDINTGTSSTGLTFSSRLKISPNPDGFGVVDLHRHLEQFVSYDIDHDNLNTFQRIPNSYIYYDVTLSESFLFEWPFVNYFATGGKVGFTGSTPHYFEVGDKVFIEQLPGYTHQEYEGVHTITEVTTNSFLTSTDFAGSTPPEGGTASLASFGPTIIPTSTTLTGVPMAFNGVLNWEDVTSWDIDEYTFTLGTGALTDNKFLTIAPNSANNGGKYEVTREDRIWFNCYNEATPSTATIDSLEVKTYNSSGSLDSHFRISNDYSANNDANRFLSIGVGPWNLENTSSTYSVISGSSPIIDDNVSYYTVAAYNTSNGRLSQEYRFDIVSPCTIYETYRLIFLDKLGSFLNVNFNKVSRENVSIKRINYKQNYGYYNPSTNTWGYNSWGRGLTNLDNQISETIKLNSDWVNEDTSFLIQEMIESPQVYHLDENGTLRAINILTSSFERKKKINDQIFNYSIEFEYSNRNTTQRG